MAAHMGLLIPPPYKMERWTMSLINQLMVHPICGKPLQYQTKKWYFYVVMLKKRSWQIFEGKGKNTLNHNWKIKILEITCL